MLKRNSILLSVFAALIMLGACNTPPDHARYIPKDALMVTALNTKALSKKVAWNIITGSKLFKQMQRQTAGNNAMDLDNSGIDIINTFYVYVKGNGGMDGKVTALIPLSDAGKWEAYVKKVFPTAAIKLQGSRKMATLANGMYAGWTSNLLIIMSGSVNDYRENILIDSVGSPMPNVVDDSTVAIAMENAFSVTEENALTGNPRFAKLLKAGHDISFWMNYDQLMTQYMNQGMSKMMGGVTLSNVLWKDAAFAGGMNFEKGKITGDMQYYVGDDMKDAAKELGGTNADKDMLDRLPKQNLNMAMSLHLSTKGLKAMLDKTGMLGLANIALSAQGMNADYILDAFTGDMAIAINDLEIKKDGQQRDSMMTGMSAFGGYSPKLNAIYVLKINKKENFNKLLDMSIGDTIPRINNNTYCMPMGHDSMVIMTSDNYAVVSNKSVNAINYLQGGNKGQKGDGAAKIYGHPFSMYLDVQEMLKWLDPAIAENAGDRKKITAAKNLLENVLVTGGAFTGNAFNYHMDVNFVNKDENSLLSLMDLGMTLQQKDSVQAVK